MTKHNHTLRLLMAAVMMCLSVSLMAQQSLLYEYFIGSDPGIGNGKVVTATTDSQGNVSFDIDEDEFKHGVNVLGLRAFYPTDTVSRYSPTILSTVFVSLSGNIEYAECFWDTDPGYGNGTPISFTPGEELTITSDIPTDGIAAGMHKLYVRTYGSLGWSPTMQYEVYVSQGNLNVTYAEYFWNTDPGFGNGTPITLTEGEEVAIDALEIPTTDVHGDPTLYLRTYGAKGWSPTVAYVVSVDAEGSYTLNSAEATDLEGRKFQTIADAFWEFAERGVGGDVVITAKNTNTTYQLDLSVDSTFADTKAISENLQERGNIMLTAANGSNNTLAITAADTQMALVVNLMAIMEVENITVLLNGDTCHFAPLYIRQDEICSDEQTNEVALSQIAPGIEARWALAQTPSATMSGYVESSTGNLPSMQLKNSATGVDSLLYNVNLTTADGYSLYSYTYIIYTHARLAGRTFSNMKPTNGNTADPGTLTLSWSAFSDAKEYIVDIEHKPTGNDTIAAICETVTTEKANCTITAEPGYTYSWQVRAIGTCDTLTSSQMAFKVRHLPDLVADTIIVPEYAEAGNTITVKATIRNAGLGETVVTSWTDRLYYTLDNVDFASATTAKSISHSGNLKPDSTYQLTFTMTVPEQDSGMLYLYVAADATKSVKETDNDNNYIASAGITLKPFYVNADDLTALRKLYKDFGGDQWSGEKWDTTSVLIKSTNWSGVTFDADGCVKAVNLTNRNLKGLLSETTAPAFSNMTSLNMSRNGLTGDIATFIAQCESLTSLNMEYNNINTMTTALPSTITSVNLNYQNMSFSTKLPVVSELQGQEILIGGVIEPETNDVITYNHSKADYSLTPNLRVMSTDLKKTYGTITFNSSTFDYTFSPSGTLIIEQGTDVIIRAESGSAAYSVLPATIKYVMGDANISGNTDVNDVQRTLNYILNSNNTGALNLSAANTYEADDVENYINVQDIVSTVNIVLDNESAMESASLARNRNMAPMAKPANMFSTTGKKVVLNSADEIAAFQLNIRGVSASQIKLLLKNSDFSMQTRNTADGVSIVVFSMTGKTILPGQTDILRLAAEATVTAASCSDKFAQPVDAGAESNDIAGIDNITGGTCKPTISMGGNSLTINGLRDGKATVSVYTTNGVLLVQKTEDTVDGSIVIDISHVDSHSVYIVNLECVEVKMAFKINRKK